MDAEWDLSKWKPTDCFPQEIGFENLRGASNQIRDCTKLLKYLPYEAETWQIRSTLLCFIGYPELAVGDAYKARLLIDGIKDIVKGDDSVIGKRAIGDLTRKWVLAKTQNRLFETCTPSNENFVAAEWLYRLDTLLTVLLPTFLLRGQCHWDASIYLSGKREGLPGYLMMRYDIIKDKAQCYLNQKLALPPSTRANDEDNVFRPRMGLFMPQGYPWMESDMNRTTALPRSDHLWVGTSSVGGDQKNRGVFARHTLEPGKVALEEKPFLCVTSTSSKCESCARSMKSNRIQCKGCTIPFCSNACLEQSKSHKVTCGKDLSFVKCSKANGQLLMTQTMLMAQKMRIAALASIIQEQPAHPLVSAAVGVIKGPPMQELNLLVDYVEPIMVLQQLGVDPFANHDYDTWVLLTIFGRLANNGEVNIGEDQKTVNLLGKMSPLINHSCEPNLMGCFNLGVEGLTTLHASEKIRKNEEVFTSYLNALEIMTFDYHQRQAALERWLPDGCKCPRCLREMPRQS